MGGLNSRTGKDGPLYCSVYGDELEWQGASTVRFDVRAPDARFMHFSVEQPQPLNRAVALRHLLSVVQARFPAAKLFDLPGREYIQVVA